MFSFNPNPFIRHSFWNLIFGGFLTSLTVYGSNQATIQRYLTMRTVKDAQKALFINLIGTFLILTITCICGLIAYAVYYDCDLLVSKKINKGEQILPYLVIDLLGNLPGIPGLFVACIYSASLSTVSSGLNSLAAVCLKDIIQPFFFKNSSLNESKATIISKLLAAFFGITTICIAFFCQYLSSTVLQISLSIFGILGGPLLGVISLGMFCNFANSFGAFSGLIISTAVNLWIGIGAIFYNKSPISKPVSIKGCGDISNLYLNTTLTQKDEKFEFIYIYRLSYLWYAGLSMFICFIFGIVISWITGLNDSKLMDKRLFFHWKNFKIAFKEEKQIKKNEGKTNSALDLTDEIILNQNSEGILNVKTKSYFTRF